MKPIHGFWLIVINWTFGLLSRILLIITQGRGVWLNALFFLSPIVNLALGLVAPIIAYSGQMQIKYRIALVLTGLAMLVAGALGLFTTLTPYGWVQWPSLELIMLPLGMVIETVLIFGAVVLGLAGATTNIKRFVTLSVPTLRTIEILSDLTSPNVGWLVSFVLTLVVLLGSYRLFTYPRSTA